MVHLADGFRPAAREDLEGVTWVSTADESALRFEQRLSAADWAPSGWPRVWSAALAIGQAIGSPPAGEPAYRLTAGELEFRDVTEEVRLDRIDELPPGSFAVVGDRAYIVVEGGAPALARLSTYLHRGRSDGGRWRTSTGRITADGIGVWPGTRESVHCSRAGETTLSVGLALAVGNLARAQGQGWTFLVRVDGQEVLRRAIEPAELHTTVWVSAALPAGGGRESVVEFRVEGPPAVAAFLSPRLHAAPAQPDERPNIVLFVADTFRADNMAAYGGRAGITSHLDEWAREARTFSQAWSPSTWTLPAQASLLSGLHPKQHGATSSLHSLPRELETLPEELRSAGYRTVAVTDALYVSSKYGLDQGFEVFDEAWVGMEETVERTLALAGDDDGRPLFLFVQSYAVHAPYSASEAATAWVGEHLGPHRTWEEITAEIDDNRWGWERGQPVPAGLQELVREFERLYRAGVVDFDRSAGELLAELDRRGVTDRGHVIFTSDHGEAFGEHLELYHGNSLWEEVLSVPLLVRGPGWSPGVTAEPASLLDVAPTIARLAGLADVDWQGADLGSLPEGRRIFSFGCFETRTPDTVALRAGHRKVVMTADEGGLQSAWDLHGDPEEREDLRGEEWSQALTRGARDRLRELSKPHADSEDVSLSPTDKNRLRALGYLGDD